MKREYQETWFIVVDENREILGNMQTDSVDMFTDSTVGEFLASAKLGLQNILRNRDSGNLKVYVDIQSDIPLPEDTPVGGYGYLYEDPLVIVVRETRSTAGLGPKRHVYRNLSGPFATCRMPLREFGASFSNGACICI